MTKKKLLFFENVKNRDDAALVNIVNNVGANIPCKKATPNPTLTTGACR